MKSKQSTAIDSLLRKAKAMRSKKLDMQKELAKKKKQNSQKYKPPKMVQLVMRPEQSDMAKTTVYKLGKGKTCVLYFHGGSYVDPPLVFHWRFLQQLVREADVTAYLPLYGRAPQHHCYRTVLHMKRVYMELAQKVGAENIIIMGDSAGGGLALAVCEYLANKKLPQPKKLILLSPWLDVDMTNDYKESESSDPVLSVKELRFYGQCYRHNLPEGHYLASPLFGVSKDLPETHVFAGEIEVFYPDCLELIKKADEVGACVRLYSYPEMWHVFLLYPIPEAREARKKVIELITSSEEKV